MAWQLAQEKGLAEFTLRDVAARVGMRAPSLYTHFESKHAIYDAMFGQGWTDYEQLAQAELADLPQAPRPAVRRAARTFFDFAVANPARHQLLNQRTIPGFEPSPESYAPAVRVLEMGRQLFRDRGLSDTDDYDIWVAMIGGLINQQLANDPGGTRWSALLDRAIDIWADGVGLPPDPSTTVGGPTHRARVVGPGPRGAPHEHHDCGPGPAATPSRPRSHGRPRCGWPRRSTSASQMPSTLSRPTAGPGQPTAPTWDVRQLVAHVAGMATFASTPLEMARQMRAAKARQHEGQALVDAQTAVQVAERDHLGTDELRAELRRIGPRAAKGRRRTPGFVRRMRLPEPQVVNGAPETWSLGYLIDVILTRDPWMHRLDLARATGRAPTLTADHDGVVVADVVLEWARRHGRPYRLDLTGPAGGSWRSGTGGEEIVMDAADFCRVVAGRPGPAGEGPSGLLATHVPF